MFQLGVSDGMDIEVFVLLVEEGKPRNYRPCPYIAPSTRNLPTLPLSLLSETLRALDLHHIFGLLSVTDRKPIRADG
jgi:hypothetical protein